MKLFFAISVLRHGERAYFREFEDLLVTALEHSHLQMPTLDDYEKLLLPKIPPKSDVPFFDEYLEIVHAKNAALFPQLVWLPDRRWQDSEIQGKFSSLGCAGDRLVFHRSVVRGTHPYTPHSMISFVFRNGRWIHDVIGPLTKLTDRCFGLIVLPEK
ncbi:MAG: hypothetical protein JWP09_287 [Candidatus Taylorbacteria bacterium]|nr:hypothetical protein [Candidatus Taylorbacteria bacterium]